MPDGRTWARRADIVALSQVLLGQLMVSEGDQTPEESVPHSASAGRK